MIATVSDFPVTLIEVEAVPVTRIGLVFKYSNDKLNYKTALSPGIPYKIIYLDGGELKQVIGVIAGASRHFSVSSRAATQVAEWIITVDVSTKYQALQIKIPTTNIRYCKVYVKGMDDDNSVIINATTHGCNVYGTINNVNLSDIVYDSDGETILKAKVLAGEIDTSKDPNEKYYSFGNGGCSKGTNGSGNTVFVENGMIIGGSISEGKFLTGKVTGGTLDSIANTLTGCTITEGCISECAVTDSTVYNGTLVDTNFQYAIIFNPTRSGEEIVTTGGTTVDDNTGGGSSGGGGSTETGTNITTGGTATGGNVTGDKALVNSNGNWYIVEGPFFSTGGTSSGGTLIGGVMSGGTKVGAAYVHTTVKGGVYSGGVDVGGTVTIGDGYIYPRSSYDGSDIDINAALNSGIRILDKSYMATASEKEKLVTNEDWEKFLYEKNLPQDTAFDWDGLVIFNDSQKGIGSNIGTANI